MNRRVLLTGLALSLMLTSVIAQVAPKPPLTKQDADRGRQLYQTLWEMRNDIKDFRAPMEPFKIIGNLYFVGIADGNGFLLTSPQGHILFGTGYNDSGPLIEKSIEKLGFKLSDVKVILVNHYHIVQAGGAAYLRAKTGAQVMTGFGDVVLMEHDGRLPGTPAPGPDTRTLSKATDNPFGGFRGPDSMYKRLPSGSDFDAVKIDRALFDRDVIKVGPLEVTAHLMPTHTPGSVAFTWTVRDGGRDYKMIQYCCWEHPDDYSRSATISQATWDRIVERLHSLMPVDVYLESGTYAWGGLINQPSGTWKERMDKLRANPKLFIDPNVFRQIQAAREVDFAERMAKVAPMYKDTRGSH